MRREGYEVLTLPLEQGVENHIPTDFLFAVADGSGPVKLFGLQYKALYRNGGDHWRLSPAQHGKIQTIPWITYCLSEMRELREQDNALAHARFARAAEVEPPRVDEGRRPRMRWAGFLRELRACRAGAVVSNHADVRAALTPPGEADLPEQLRRMEVDVFIVDFASRTAVHASPDLSLAPGADQ